MKIIELKDLVPNLVIIGDCEFDALGMSTSQYKNERVLAFLTDEKYVDSIIRNKNIVAVVIKKEHYDNNILLSKLPAILSENPKLTFYEIHNKLTEVEFYWKSFQNQISETALISPDSIIAKRNVKIGENSIIEPGVIIHPGTIIGDNVIIRSGTTIGSSGFQFLNLGNIVFSVQSAGKVIIKDFVEIQHNCCVDRGVFGGDTILNEYVKTDNFVHIAHDDIIGSRTFITAGVKFSGRVIVGSDCWIGVNATISNGITIGNKCKISLGSVVTKDVPDNSTVSGNFAIEHNRFIEFIKSIR